MLKNIILPLFTKDDIAELPQVVSWIRAVSPERLWIIHNPDMGVDSPEALASFDKEIAAIETAMKSASDRQDFVTAGRYKEQLETKKMDRDGVRREGWKKIGKLDLDAIYDKVLSCFGSGVCPNIQATPLIECYEAAQIFEVLRGLRASWPKDMPHGEFAVVWPRTVVNQAISGQPKLAKATDLGAISKAAATVHGWDKSKTAEPKEAPKDRRSQLRAMKFAGISQRAKKLGLNPTGKPFDTIIDEVLAKEEEMQLQPA